MMATLDDLSLEDLQSLKAGNLDGVSLQGLQTLKALRGAQPKQPQPKKEIDPYTPEGRRKDTVDQLGGIVRGAGSIGATLLAPFDWAEQGIERLMGGKPRDVSLNEERRQGISNALSSLGVDTSSNAYEQGKFVTEMAGTAGIPMGTAPNLMGRTLKAGAAGGASAGLSDPGNAMTGAAITGMFPVIGSAVGKAADIAKPVLYAPYRIIEPYLKGGPEQIKGRLLNALAGSRAPEVIDALENSYSVVPGSYRNAGEAAASAGSTGFSAGQEALKKGFSTAEYAAREAEQQAARKKAIEGIGRPVGSGPKEDVLPKAIKARADAANVNYSKAFKQVIDGDPVLSELLSRPRGKVAESTAAELAAEDAHRVFKIGKNLPARKVESSVLDASGNPFFTIAPEEFAKYPVQSLHNVKQKLDDVISHPERYVGIGSTDQKAALGTRAALIKWLGGKSKAYDFARTEHARLSDPINRLEVGQQLSNALENPLGAETAAMFGQALRDAPGTIKAATGIPRYKSFEEILPIGETFRAKNVLSDLQNKEKYKDLASAGAAEANKLIRIETKPVEPPGLLHRGVMIARAVLERTQGKANQKMLEQLAQDMLDPQKAAALMKAAGGTKKASELAAWAKAMRDSSPAVVGASLSED